MVAPFIGKLKRLAVRCEKTATNSATLTCLFALVKSVHRGWRVRYSGGRGALSCTPSAGPRAFCLSGIFFVTLRQPSD